MYTTCTHKSIHKLTLKLKKQTMYRNQDLPPEILPERFLEVYQTPRQSYHS